MPGPLRDYSCQRAGHGPQPEIGAVVQKEHTEKIDVVGPLADYV